MLEGSVAPRDGRWKEMNMFGIIINSSTLKTHEVPGNRAGSIGYSRILCILYVNLFSNSTAIIYS